MRLHVSSVVNVRLISKFCPESKWKSWTNRLTRALRGGEFYRIDPDSIYVMRQSVYDDLFLSKNLPKPTTPAVQFSFLRYAKDFKQLHLKAAQEYYSTRTLDEEPSPPIVLSPIEKKWFQAVAHLDQNLIRQLLNQQQKLLTTRHPQHGATATHVLASGHHSDRSLMDLLLENGADINARAFNGSTPLHWACGSGNLGMIETLLEHGANPRVTTSTWETTVFGKGSGQTALHWAAESGCAQAVEILMEHDVFLPFFSDERQAFPQDLTTQEEVQVAMETHNTADFVALQFEIEKSV